MARSELRDRPGASAIQPIALTRDDLAGGLALSDAAGWNQTADDWSLFIGAGHALGVHDASGRLVATAATLGYGAQAWISMVLVAAHARHRGVASALVSRCIAEARAGGATPVLDATPAGAEVYRRIGFVAGFAFQRWQAVAGVGKPRPASLDDAVVECVACAAADGRTARDAICTLDRAASGLDRRLMLEAFLARPSTHAWLGAQGDGFVIAREGRRAWQIGPLVAASDAQAIALLAVAVSASGARIVIDVPEQRHSIGQWLALQGFVAQRSFVRMAFGAAPPPLDARSIVLAGPEFG